MNLSTFVFGSLNLMIQLYADYYKEQDLKTTLKELEPDLGLPKITTHDFIVVGGGTAGNLLAGKLSKKFNVLLLEMGGEPVPQIYPAHIDSIHSLEMRSNPAINEIYRSIPQSTSALDDNGIAIVHAGRMLGGSGSHNSNVYNRGSPLDYDYWAKLLGDDSWSYKNMLQHWKSNENFVGYLVNNTQRLQYYGQFGPLRVDTDTPDFLVNWFDAAKELGHPIADPNAYQMPSFTPQEISVRNGIRESTYDAFIRPTQEKTTKSLGDNEQDDNARIFFGGGSGSSTPPPKTANPRVIRYSQVEEILIDDKNNAYGVTYRRHGIPQIAHAKKEVIISAGAFGSPIVLFKSGIGPAAQLAAANIPVKKDVPGLGQNLWDHVMLVLTFRRGDNYKDPNFEEELVKFHKPTRTGVFAQHRRTQALVASSRAQADGEGNWADFQVQMIDQVFVDTNPGGASWEVNLSRPKSNGQIIFNASAFLAGETENGKLINTDFRYFSDPTDMDVMIEGLNLATSIMEGTKAFQGKKYKLDESVLPASCQGLQSRSNDFWKCALMRQGTTQWHWSGTCKMGKTSDPMAVLDSKFNVIGFNKLKVVDASAMPKVTNSNLNAATMAVASKAAAELLQKY